MTETTKTTGTRKASAPSHIVWFAPERKNVPWTRIGAMWPTNSGKGFRQVLNTIPVKAGNIVVLPFEPKATPEAGA